MLELWLALLYLLSLSWPAVTLKTKYILLQVYIKYVFSIKLIKSLNVYACQYRSLISSSVNEIVKTKCVVFFRDIQDQGAQQTDKNYM